MTILTDELVEKAREIVRSHVSPDHIVLVPEHLVHAIAGVIAAERIAGLEEALAIYEGDTSHFDTYIPFGAMMRARIAALKQEPDMKQDWVRQEALRLVTFICPPERRTPAAVNHVASVLADVIAAERERAAKVAEGEFGFDMDVWISATKKDMAEHMARAIAAAIRKGNA